MTLLESVVAFVLLAVVGIASLELVRSATSLEARSVAWSQAVAAGESALDAAAAGAPVGDPELEGVQVVRRPWPADPAVDVIEVTVPMSSGASFRLSRLVPARPIVAAATLPSSRAGDRVRSAP